MSTKNKRGNAKPSKKRQRNARPRQEEIHLTGIGVEICNDPKLVECGGEYVDEDDNEKAAKKRKKELKAEILNRQAILGIKIFRIGNHLFTDDSKHNLKVTKVKEPVPPEEPVRFGAPADKTEGDV
jgi:hypothetical protein